VSPDLDAVLAQLPRLAGVPRRITPLTGGLSNHSFKVTTPSLTAVLRLPAGDAGLLGVDREAEYRNTVAAHAAGIGPAVLDRLPDAGVLVLGWLEGRTLTPADLGVPAVLDRVVAACRTLHAGPQFSGDVDLVASHRRYRTICAEHGFTLPPGYDDHQGTVDRIAHALAAGAEGVVPCHNDLVAANILDSGDRVSFVDYEYSGNADPCFDLGNLAESSGLPAEDVVDRYYGRPRPSRSARARLYGILAAHTWTLWAAIRGGSADPPDGLGDWAAEQYARAASTLTSTRLPGIITAATARD
jgi:thiamine kinase-like enzyme